MTHITHLGILPMAFPGGDVPCVTDKYDVDCWQTIRLHASLVTHSGGLTNVSVNALSSAGCVPKSVELTYVPSTRPKTFRMRFLLHLLKLFLMDFIGSTMKSAIVKSKPLLVGSR